MTWYWKLHRLALFALASFTIGIGLAWLTPGPSASGSGTLPTVVTTVKLSAPPRVVYGMGPIANIAPWMRAVATCIIKRESGSTWAHMNLDVSKTGSSGIFQFENGSHQAWWRWAPKIGVYVQVWQATVLQQEQVFVEVVRHDGFAPWTDGCYR